MVEHPIASTHSLFGLDGERFQVLYHFAMGGAVEDPRLQTRPPYEHLEGASIPAPLTLE